ncbi:protein disabled isoform X2 [Rhipicephalus sanguineus]|uniref:protein disabled isoform X2 n=1 Tax=Rhipicephalus sanguineus TaxID=34632 RepID=UPI001894064D|nr:protein disabled isoform X2 [Rhipicephalus sanguineus]
MAVVLDTWSHRGAERLWEKEEEDEDSPQEDAMNNHASTKIDGGRRAVRRSNPRKEKAGSSSGSSGKGGDPFRFEGEGLLFRAKLIGSQPVPEARGDRMCQDAMTRLKMVVRSSGEHKQRVQLTVSLQGIKIRDDKTGELVFHHPVHRISFISQDASDARAFGYVCMTQDGCHRFIGIKTEKAASQLVVALRDLFQVVLEMKQHELRQAQLEQRQQLQEWKPPTDFNNRGEAQEVICSPQAESCGEPTSSADNKTPTVDDLLDLQSELDSLQEGIQQMETTIAAAATLVSPDPFDTSFIVDPRQQQYHHHPGSRAFLSEPATPVGPPPPLLPPPPPTARASQSTAIAGTAQQQHRAVPPPRTLPFGAPPTVTASLPPTPLPDLFADLDPLSEGSGKSGRHRHVAFGELKSPLDPLAEDGGSRQHSAFNELQSPFDSLAEGISRNHYASIGELKSPLNSSAEGIGRNQYASIGELKSPLNSSSEGVSRHNSTTVDGPLDPFANIVGKPANHVTFGETNSPFNSLADGVGKPKTSSGELKSPLSPPSSKGLGRNFRSPPRKPPAQLTSVVSGWQTFEEEEEDDGPPPPAFPPPPPPLAVPPLDEGFCSGSNASSVSPIRPAKAASSSTSSGSSNLFSRCGAQDPFADEFFAAPASSSNQDCSSNGSQSRPALLPGLSSSSPWPVSPQTAFFGR